ncbi:Zn-ribbon domain-containing OB-fold protein [Gordonia humi]|uniref:Zn-ribbon domain-containing OB-fold protein n=1 Tax=Gordonia humi TaxID=686429 RepID=A0A840EQL6_9ACTN|nr:Zn-ribbon domain-containing OB-fold protein [Gordonia humi]MBB4135125.1 hypothetical protein [Gordonia humi]
MSENDVKKPAKPRADLPTVEPGTAPYWEAAARGVLLVAECGDCGAIHHYPRPFCPSCWSENVSAIECSGHGTLYTYSTVYMNDLHPFKDRLPYVAAIIELAEGPRLMTNIEGCEPADLEVGMAVKADFRPISDDYTATVFRPA